MDISGTTEDIIRAGQLILSVAQGDVPGAITEISESRDDPRETVALILQLVSVAMSCMEMVDGDRWAESLNLAMLGLSDSVPDE